MSRNHIPAAVDRLSEVVEVEWPRWLGGDPGGIEWVLQSTARPTASTSVILYAIEPATRRVALVAKASRDPRFGAVTRREAERMGEARAALGPGLEQTVPRPFGLLDVGADTYLITEFAVEGQRWERLDASTRVKAAAKLAAWLGELHRASERPAGAIDTGIAGLVASTYSEVFAPPAEVARRLAEAAGSVEAELTAATTEILVHGDFWPGNWRFDQGGGYAVIDWENAHWSPSPILDEFLYPLSDLTLGRLAPDDDLMSFSSTYRMHRGLSRRPVSEAALATLWTAAEVATRTHRRWGVVEEWAVRWHQAVMSLAVPG